MATISDAELRIAAVAGDPPLWKIEITWSLVVQSWETGSWCRETVELRRSDPGGGRTLVRWQSQPWRLEPKAPVAGGDQFQLHRSLPAAVVATAHSDGDRSAGAGRGPAPSLCIPTAERLHAVVTVEPVLPGGDVARTPDVTPATVTQA
ncbi:MAG: hypothetical protein ACRD03_04065 [Acidimicrobiales bacterium]